MVKRLKMVDILKEDNIVRYKCQRCGMCCKNNNSIVLMPYDIYSMSKYLNLEIPDFLFSYTMITMDENNIPIIRIAMDKQENKCPFLKYSKNGHKYECDIYSNKPIICTLSPLSLLLKQEDKAIKLYYLKVDQCEVSKVSKNRYTIQEFVKSIEEIEDEIKVSYLLQLEVYSTFKDTDIINNIKKLKRLYEKAIINKDDKVKTIIWLLGRLLTLSKENIENYLDYYMFYSYYNYDISKPFIEQAENNLNTLRKISEDFKEFNKFLLETIEDDNIYYVLSLQKEDV